MAAILPGAIFLSGCTTAGTGNVAAKISQDAVSATLKFGANMSGPWKGRVELRRSPNESTVSVIGEGADVDRTPGHEATVSVVEKGADAVIEGARRGIAP